MIKNLNDKLITLYANLDKTNQEFRNRVNGVENLDDLTVDVISDLVERRNAILKAVGKFKTEADNNFYRFISTKMNGEASATIYRIIKSLLEAKNATNAHERLVIVDDLVCVNASKEKEVKKLLNDLRIEEERLQEAKKVKIEEPKVETVNNLEISEDNSILIEEEDLGELQSIEEEEFKNSFFYDVLKTKEEPKEVKEKKKAKRKIEPSKFLERGVNSLNAKIPLVKSKLKVVYNKTLKVGVPIALSYLSIAKEKSYKNLKTFLSIAKMNLIKTKALAIACKNKIRTSCMLLGYNLQDEYLKIQARLVKVPSFERNKRYNLNLAVSALACSLMLGAGGFLTQTDTAEATYVESSVEDNDRISYLNDGYNLDEKINNDNTNQEGQTDYLSLTQEYSAVPVGISVESLTQNSSTTEDLGQNSLTEENLRDSLTGEEDLTEMKARSMDNQGTAEAAVTNEENSVGEEQVVIPETPVAVPETPAVAPETPTTEVNVDNNLNAKVDPNMVLSDNSANPGLVAFNPNNFYRCPEEVSTSTLASIFGLNDEQFATVYGIICSESAAAYNGYNEVFNCFYTLLNRISTSEWIGCFGTNIYKQATASGQYVVYEKGSYRSYLGYSEEQRGESLLAMRDAMYNFIIDFENRPHRWTSFRSNDTTSFSQNLFTSRGNRYASEMRDSIYPEFLQSEAAINLRNQAFGIINSEDMSLSRR